MSQEPVFIGIFGGAIWRGRAARQHKKAGRGFREKIPRGQISKSSCGTGGGPHVQTQMINLVNGVVTRGLATTDATSDRVGARGAKLLNGLYEHHWPAGLQLPFRFTAQSTQAPRTRQASIVSPAKGSASRRFVGS